MINKNIESSDYTIVGKKIFLGISGLVLLGFIIAHLLGNLTILVGSDAINAYGHFLHQNKALVYTARVILLSMLLTHLYFSISLTLTNEKAQQVAYDYKYNFSNTFASKTMIFSGLVILLFLIYHLLHFTFGYINPTFHGLMDDKNRLDIYKMVTNNFYNGYISLIYVVSLVCLGLHLSHAFFSVCQTLSLINTHRSIYLTKKISLILSIIIILGYISIPTTIFFEIISTK
jgi:succinate dehydrogenase / fumarate reductase cytochrome b subunit